ncbi:MAG: hypothetical protein EBQ85_11305 [Proteobacteria bacterium]|nr:hypothetical protein [Pseudomonadota bacterium]
MLGRDQKQFLVGMVVGASLFSPAPLFSGEIDSRSPKSQDKVSVSQTPLSVLKILGNNLNSIAQKAQVKERVTSITDKVTPEKRSVPSNTASEKDAVQLLPPLSTDPTRINKVDVDQLSLESAGNANSLWKTGQDALEKAGGLPLPTARVVPEVGERAGTKGPKEAPLQSPEDLTNSDTLPQLQPQKTRFGKDKYDDKLFKEEKPVLPTWGPAPQAENTGPAVAWAADPQAQDEKDKDQEKEQAEKKAREQLNKVILEYAERTEDKGAFSLVDYYDLRGLVAKNQDLIGKIQNDEFDDRFIKNARTIYERFGNKDSSEDKEPFEQFLRRMQPPSVVFRPSEAIKKPIPRNTETHREPGRLQ